MGNSQVTPRQKYPDRTSAFDGDKCVLCPHPKSKHFFGGCHGSNVQWNDKWVSCNCQGDREFILSGYHD